jgi:hypothetical protein
MEQVTAVIAAFVLAFGPLAIGDTKLVDGVRHIFEKDPNAPLPKYLWIGLAMGIAVASCVLFNINTIAPVIALVPRFADATLNATTGQVLTGVATGGMASYWHSKGV